MSAPSAPPHSSHHLLVREGAGARVLGGGGGGLLLSVIQLCLSYPIWMPPPSSHLPSLFLLQMVPHPEEVPIALGPDLLTVRKSGVSRTHSLPNDSYMCRDGSAAEGSLGHGGWGLPKAQSGTGTVAGQLGSHWGPPPGPRGKVRQ